MIVNARHRIPRHDTASGSRRSGVHQESGLLRPSRELPAGDVVLAGGPQLQLPAVVPFEVPIPQLAGRRDQAGVVLGLPAGSATARPTAPAAMNWSWSMVSFHTP